MSPVRRSRVICEHIWLIFQVILFLRICRKKLGRMIWPLLLMTPSTTTNDMNLVCIHVVNSMESVQSHYSSYSSLGLGQNYHWRKNWKVLGSSGCFCLFSKCFDQITRFLKGIALSLLHRICTWYPWVPQTWQWTLPP